MVNILDSQLDLVFSALADPTRRQILNMLNSGTSTVGALAEPFKMSLAAVSKHIKILEEAHLISREKKGRIHECSINPAALRRAEEALHFYSKFWNDSLDQFAHSIETSKRRK